MAAQEFAEAKKVLGDCGTLLDAAKFYAKHHGGKLPTRNTDDVAAEMLASKKADGMSDRCISDLKSRLKIFTKTFHGPIAEISCAELQERLNGLGYIPAADDPFKTKECLMQVAPKPHSRILSIKRESVEIPRAEFDQMLKVASEQLMSEMLCPALDIAAAGGRHRFAFAACPHRPFRKWPIEPHSAGRHSATR